MRGRLRALGAGLRHREARILSAITRDDVQGAVHCHTTYSDGKSSIAEMADAAAALGLSYLTITDRSQSAG